MFNKDDCILSSLNAEERLALSPTAKRTQYSKCSAQNPDSVFQIYDVILFFRFNAKLLKTNSKKSKFETVNYWT